MTTTRLAGRADIGDRARCAPSARLQRSAGAVRLAFKRRDSRTVLDEMHQSGCCKLRLPKPEPDRDPEAVLINTAGGLTDGDRIAADVSWRPGTRAAVTTQAAERVYRSRGGPAHVDNVLSVSERAIALWLPQETILFDGSRLSRRLSADIAPDGQLLACESMVFGRHAMGETVRDGTVRDVWRVRYAGRLVYADGFHLDGNISELLARPAVANGATAVASVIYAGARATDLAEALGCTVSTLRSAAGCSAVGSATVVRMLARSGFEMRQDLISVLQVIVPFLNGQPPAQTTGVAAALPRVWSY